VDNYSTSDKNDIYMRFDLSIIIPTLNRPDTVLANLHSLIKSFNKINPKISIQILISENDSDVNLKIDGGRFKLLLEKNKIKNINFLLIERSKRLSLGKHMHVLSKSVNCSWMMWIGDDDLLTPTYLKYVTEIIESDNSDIQSVFPVRFGPPGDVRNKGITEEEFFHLANSNESIQRNVEIKSYNYNDKNLVYIINRGTQLSGLLYRKEIMDISNQFLPEDNLFPWVCHQIIAIKRGTILSVNGHHVRITSDTDKLFSYREDGLLPEISEAILSGFSSERQLGTYYASKVIKDIAYWRIFKTSKTGLGALKNYILSFNHRKTDGKVFFMALPKVAIKCLYHHLVHSFPRLYIKLRFYKNYFAKN